MKSAAQEKLKKLQQSLRELGSCAIAYSGGVDSTFLVKVAYDTLGNNAVAVTACSSIHPQREVQQASRFAQYIGIAHVIIHSEELDIPHFSDNPPDRCYYCKKELFKKIKIIAQNRHLNYVVDGSTADDLSDFRPGVKACRELGVRSLLQEAELTKQDIRSLSASMHLKSATKAGFACLASRFPYGIKITEERLKQVESAEDFLFSLGIKQCRVRYHTSLARIEVPTDEFQTILIHSQKILKRFKELCFTYVALDIEGYRSGSLNEVLDR